MICCFFYSPGGDHYVLRKRNFAYYLNIENLLLNKEYTSSRNDVIYCSAHKVGLHGERFIWKFMKSWIPNFPYFNQQH